MTQVLSNAGVNDGLEIVKLHLLRPLNAAASLEAQLSSHHKYPTIHKGTRTFGKYNDKFSLENENKNKNGRFLNECSQELLRLLEKISAAVMIQELPPPQQQYT